MTEINTQFLCLKIMLFMVSVILLSCVCIEGKSTLQKAASDDGPLLLTPLLLRGETERARVLSAVEPALFAGVKSHAGYVTVNSTYDWNTFFWYFPVEGKPSDTTPWIIWLQGGPGSSSLYGLFLEIGPIQVINGTVNRMPVTWGSEYSLLFIDNPVGTGYSYTDGKHYVTNEDQVGACLLNFLQQFLQVFPELGKAPLFIAGESYAGKYIPAFGYYIHQNRNSLIINLKGLAIGDGWIDPPTLLHNAEFSLQLGLTDPEQAQQIKELEDKAQMYWNEGDINMYIKTATRARSLFFDIAKLPSAYNYLSDYFYQNDTGNHDYVPFVTRADVRSALHVGHVPYGKSDDDVMNHLGSDVYLSVKPWLEMLIEHYAVMCYNGQLDVIVAYALSINTYHSLKWSGRDAYLKAARKPIYKTDPKNHLDVIGYVKTAGNFMDVMVRAAGHMVPADQPRAAKQMISMFIDKFK